jgi:hypothetical protein
MGCDFETNIVCKLTICVVSCCKKRIPGDKHDFQS